MITQPDIAVALGRDFETVTAADLALWGLWIDEAQLIIRNRLGDLSLLDQDDLAYVVRNAVVAKVNRPNDGATQVDVSVDDARVSKIYPSTSVFIRPEWWDMLSPESESESQAFSTRPGFVPDRRCW